MMSALKLEQVSKRYGATQVIDELSLEIHRGEFIVLLGASGCGKTSLLRMVAGLEEVSGGRVFIDGKDVTLTHPGQRNVAMVFQHYALYPHMTVRDNLAFGLRNVRLKGDEIDRRIAESARMLELTELLNRKPGQLSGGQRQRVAIARAAVKAPAIFLFDEPLSNLDAALRSRTRVELARLHRRLGATMLFVTHDQLDAMTLATRIVVMNGGSIEQVATPVEVYRRPATRFVAGFIGTPAMNFIPVARCGVAAGFTVVRLPDGSLLTTCVPDQGLSAHAGGDGELSLGIRPENLYPAASGPLSGQVEAVEFLGERSLAVLTLADGSTVTVTLNGTRPAPGETITVAIDLREAHLFDAGGRAHHARVEIQ
ncbi:sn-glycerol-3-phosphate ABC transporter ATP-binding protein UgpC [Duganella sp. FT92W]|uniref:sn-glycerol-3-phosphate ABC transporter ATP-binding protein UgpC n=2 Tax=Pseudoduganella rivuli TaxID=2666085 RepID=A0A7X2IR23_9BURK|nr:sn-glycerol-3-phosphate ABC transporter ATP-binding protein UgpC [Pseudoduganella rivuli]